MGGANGLIVAFVVAVWAAYFVPLVLRRYDEASSSSSLENLSPLSRVIQRRGSAADEPAEPVAEQRADEPQPEAPAAQAAPAPRPKVTGRAAALAAKRRRRTLLTLLAVLLIVGGLAVFSVVSPVWVAAPAAVVLAWLVACRVQVRGERGLARPSLPTVERPGWLRMPQRSARPARPIRPARSERASTPASRRVDPAEEETIVVSGQIEDVDPGRRHAMQDVPLEADALDDQLVIAVPSVSTAGEPLWDPLPVTLPTYVTKPRAGRTVRTIDFDKPGAWTSGHVEGEDIELPGRTAAAREQAPQRRASGE